MTIFSTIGDSIQVFVAALGSNSIIKEKLLDLQSLISIVITISIMYKGYLVLAGKNQDPIRDLMFDLAKKTLILTFVMNVDSWLELSMGAVSGFYEWAGGGSSLYAQMDKVAASFLDSLMVYYNKSDGLFNIGDKLAAFFISLIMIVAFLAVSFSLFFSIVATSVTNAFLIIALPLALFCLMWKPTKQVFTQWCNLFLSNIFLLLFLLVFMNFFNAWIGQIFNLNNYIEHNTSFLQILIEIPLIAAVLVQFVNVIKELAKNLAQVTLDSAVSGTAISGGAGALLGYGAKAIQNRAGGAGMITKASESAVGGLGKAASATGGYAGKAFKKARQTLQNMRNK